MKTTVTLLILLTLFSPNTFAQDYTQLGLPEGAKARLGKGTIFEIVYSPDGTRLAVASSSGIWLYDTTTHQEVLLLTGHTSPVTSITFSPDGRTLASGSGDGTTLLWDIAPPPVEPPPPVVEEVKLAEDVNGNGIVNILDLALVGLRLGQTGENDADVNGDGVVDIADLV